MNEEEAKKTLKTMKENIDKKYLKSRNSVAIETVLNLIQTQQAEIDSLKDFKEIAESKVTDLNPIGLARTNQLLSRQCHKLQEESEKKDIDIIEAKEANRQLSVELQKKDKIIDLMAYDIATNDSDLCQYIDETIRCKKYAGENKLTCDECIKQYFERKSENGN